MIKIGEIPVIEHLTKMNTQNKSKSSRIIITTHVFATGPGQNLVEFLIKKRAGDLLFIGHPLFYLRGQKGSGYKRYQKGKIIKKKYLTNFKLPYVLAYLKDASLTFYWVLKTEKKWDLFIGCGGLNAFVGILLRRFGKVKKVIFYTIDYVPERFENRMLNRFYHIIDKYCVINADQTWNLCDRIAEGRKVLNGMEGKKYERQITVPLGIWFDRIKRIPNEKKDRHSLVFMGHLIEKHGIQEVLHAIPIIIEQIPDFKFLVIGTGEYENSLKKMVNELEIEDFVEFTGFIKDHRNVENLMAKCSLAIAPYNKELDKWTYYTEPGKIKNYLAAGLPVIMTDVPLIAEDIKKNSCGVIVEYDKNDIAKAIVELMKNQAKLNEYSHNAIEFAKLYDWNIIFEKYLTELLD